jgi:hypothetical protein
MPWNSREFVVKDCDGRLLAFGANLASQARRLTRHLTRVVR